MPAGASSTRARNTPQSRNPEAVQLAYTPDSIWRNRDIFLKGRHEIVEFLRAKWAKEQGYRLRKELFAFTDNKVRFSFVFLFFFLSFIPSTSPSRRRGGAQLTWDWMMDTQ